MFDRKPRLITERINNNPHFSIKEWAIQLDQTLIKTSSENTTLSEQINAKLTNSKEYILPFLQHMSAFIRTKRQE